MTTSGNIITLDEEAQISARRIFSLIANDLAQVELEFERQARSNAGSRDGRGRCRSATGPIGSCGTSPRRPVVTTWWS